MHILLSVVRYCCSRYRTDALLHASTDKVLTCMRDDKSMTRLVMYPLETRLDAFHCRYDDDSCTCCSCRATALCLDQWRRVCIGGL